MGASLALAGASACTRTPGEHRPLRARAGGRGARPPDVLRHGDALRRRRRPRAGREPHGAPHQDRTQPRAPGHARRHRRRAQASVLSLYDPDRAQALKFLGGDPPLGELPDGDAAETPAQQASRAARASGSSPGTVISPTLTDQISDLLAAYPGEVDPVGAGRARQSTRGREAGVRPAVSRTPVRKPRSSSRSTPTSSGRPRPPPSRPRLRRPPPLSAARPR